MRLKFAHASDDERANGLLRFGVADGGLEDCAEGAAEDGMNLRGRSGEDSGETAGASSAGIPSFGEDGTDGGSTRSVMGSTAVAGVLRALRSATSTSRAEWASEDTEGQAHAIFSLAGFESFVSGGWALIPVLLMHAQH